MYDSLQYSHICIGVFLILFSRKWQWTGLILALSACIYIWVIEGSVIPEIVSRKDYPLIYVAYGSFDAFVGFIFLTTSDRSKDQGAIIQSILLFSLALIHMMGWYGFDLRGNGEHSAFSSYWWQKLVILVNILQIAFTYGGVKDGVRRFTEDIKRSPDHFSFVRRAFHRGVQVFKESK